MLDYLIFMGFVLYIIVGISVWYVISETYIEVHFHKDSIVLQAMSLLFGVIAVLASVPFLAEAIL